MHQRAWEESLWNMASSLNPTLQAMQLSQICRLTIAGCRFSSISAEAPCWKCQPAIHAEINVGSDHARWRATHTAILLAIVRLWSGFPGYREAEAAGLAGLHAAMRRRSRWT